MGLKCKPTIFDQGIVPDPLGSSSRPHSWWETLRDLVIYLFIMISYTKYMSNKEKEKKKKTSKKQKTKICVRCRADFYSLRDSGY